MLKYFHVDISKSTRKSWGILSTQCFYIIYEWFTLYLAISRGYQQKFTYIVFFIPSNSSIISWYWSIYLIQLIIIHYIYGMKHLDQNLSHLFFFNIKFSTKYSLSIMWCFHGICFTTRSICMQTIQNKEYQIDISYIYLVCSILYGYYTFQ